MNDDKQSLSSELHTGDWEMLRFYCSKDVLIIVGPHIALLAASEALANDNGAQVGVWIEKDWLGKPTLEQLDVWDEKITTAFTFMIVQPYVLAQLVPEKSLQN